ncbi:MAG: hypothetical protein FWD66_06540 [Paludibacter sp.]|nr:hypothetical protein [Paludibacter sp.]
MKNILFISLIVSILTPLSAQMNKTATATATPTPTQKYWFDKSKITFGGALGASFGNNYTSVLIAPQIGYNFTKYFNAGFGLQYAYYGEKSGSVSNSMNYFGMNVYGRATIANYFMVLMQPEVNRVWWSNKNSGNNGTEFVPALLVGAGVRISNVFMMLEYDVVQNEYSPYGQTIFYAVGVVF